MHCAPVVEVQKGFVYHHHVVMLSIATYQTDLLVSVLSHPRLVIVLDAISNFFYINFQNPISWFSLLFSVFIINYNNILGFELIPSMKPLFYSGYLRMWVHMELENICFLSNFLLLFFFRSSHPVYMHRSSLRVINVTHISICVDQCTLSLRCSKSSDQCMYIGFFL